MNLIVLGTNHKYCPIEIREKFVFSKRRLKEALISLSEFKDIEAAVIVSTCNRVELYALCFDIDKGVKALKRFLSAWQAQELSQIDPYLYLYIGKEAILHLFRVSAGLDSQIIGETQILEQVRLAWEQARAVEVTNKHLDSVFEEAMRVSLKVRQDTGISRDEASMASIAIELLKTRYPCLSDKRLLIIGVGKISELVIEALKKEKIKTVFISNRSYQKAQELARGKDIEVVTFDRLKEKLKDSDIIISATASPHLILRKEDIGTGEFRERLIIDLAVPRDVAPEVKDIKGISLFNLDDLTFLTELKLAQRRKEIPRAEAIIKQEVGNLCRKFFVLELEPALLP